MGIRRRDPDAGTLDSDPPEQALVVDSEGLTAAISGGAHPGMERIVERAKTFLGKQVDWAIGGFHLRYANAAAIARSVAILQRLGIDYVVPIHCTGDEAREAFRRAYGKRCLAGGSGRRIEFSQWQKVTGVDDGD
ncbi:MAG TPA: hypothetical protein VES89_03535 [Candidatus Competibacteraceae bacterium]|nr:hypothetical protein [Candidatus Competibacteraceae bacterium]